MPTLRKATSLSPPKRRTKMILDYSTTKTTHIPNFFDGEGIIPVQMRMDELGKILKGVLDPGSSIGWRTHKTSSEIIYAVAFNQ